MRLWPQKSGILGVAQGPRQYDLPLGRDVSTDFLTLLIGLMTFLGFLALAASFLISAASNRWTSGLEGRVTAEIPARSENGIILPPEDIERMTQAIADIAERHPGVEAANMMSAQEIGDLVSPWLGDSMILDKVPLPGLVAITLESADEQTIEALEAKIRDVAPGARIDRHAEWLDDFLRFTGMLQLLAALLSVVIGSAILAAVAGGVRSRMAVYRADIELLHIMGATDDYIARQFRKHSLLLSAKGAAAGAAMAAIVLGLLGILMGKTHTGLMPDITLAATHITALLCLPVMVAILAAVMAHHTVLRTLREMP